MKIDRAYLRMEIAEVTAKLKAVKKILREPKQPHVSWKTYNDYNALRSVATTLCSISAHCRGKIHMGTVKSLDDQYNLISHEIPRFLIEEPVAA